MRRAAGNPGAALLGAALGGFVPCATYTVSHAADSSSSWVIWGLVGGGLLYSAKTVWQWGRLSFNDGLKATGFVVLLEGVMVASPCTWLARAALGYLVLINAIATACLLASRDLEDRQATQALAIVASEEQASGGEVEDSDARSAAYERARALVRSSGPVSISRVKRECKVGWTTAARLVAQLKADGLVSGPERAAGPRALTGAQPAQLRLQARGES
jgi:hypothetical protein